MVTLNPANLLPWLTEASDEAGKAVKAEQLGRDAIFGVLARVFELSAAFEHDKAKLLKGLATAWSFKVDDTKKLVSKLGDYKARNNSSVMHVAVAAVFGTVGKHSPQRRSDYARLLLKALDEKRTPADVLPWMTNHGVYAGKRIVPPESKPKSPAKDAAGLSPEVNEGELGVLAYQPAKVNQRFIIHGFSDQDGYIRLRTLEVVEGGVEDEPAEAPTT